MATYISKVILDNVVSSALEDYNPVMGWRYYVDRPACLWLYVGGKYPRLGINFGNGTWHEFHTETVDLTMVHLRAVIGQNTLDSGLWQQLRYEWEESDVLQKAFPHPDVSLHGLMYAIECAALSHEDIFQYFAPDASPEVMRLLHLARLDRVRVNPRQFALYRGDEPITYIQVNDSSNNPTICDVIRPCTILDEFDSLSVNFPPEIEIDILYRWADTESRKRSVDQFAAAMKLHQIFPVAGGAPFDI